jgi:hypothetical protein
MWDKVSSRVHVKTEKGLVGQGGFSDQLPQYLKGSFTLLDFSAERALSSGVWVGVATQTAAHPDSHAIIRPGQMNEARRVFLLKAEESLSGAESEFANDRNNNCANRCYYACFQAAIAALLTEGISNHALSSGAIPLCRGSSSEYSSTAANGMRQACGTL